MATQAAANCELKLVVVACWTYLFEISNLQSELV